MIDKEKAMELVSTYGSQAAVCRELGFNKSDISKLLNGKISIYRPGVKSPLNKRKIYFERLDNILSFQKFYNVLDYVVKITVNNCNVYRKEPLAEEIKDYIINWWFGRSGEQLDRIENSIKNKTDKDTQKYIVGALINESIRFNFHKNRKKLKTCMLNEDYYIAG